MRLKHVKDGIMFDCCGFTDMCDDEYILYCQNAIRCYFVDRYLHSIEYEKLRVQHRIGYIVDHLKLDRRFAKLHLNSLYGMIAYGKGFKHEL